MRDVRAISTKMLQVLRPQAGTAPLQVRSLPFASLPAQNVGRAGLGSVGSAHRLPLAGRHSQLEWCAPMRFARWI